MRQLVLVLIIIKIAIRLRNQAILANGPFLKSAEVHLVTVPIRAAIGTDERPMENGLVRLDLKFVREQRHVRKCGHETVGNFILHETGMDQEVYQRAMLARHIRVGRDMGTGRGWNRLSMGTVGEMGCFLEQLRQLHS